MRFRDRSRIEKEDIRTASTTAVAKGQTPKPLDLDRAALHVFEEAMELAIRSEGQDVAIAEVAHEQVTSVRTETQGSQGDPPRRIELRDIATCVRASGEAMERTGLGIERIDQAAAHAILGCGEHDKHGTIDHLNIERGVTGGRARITKLRDEAAVGAIGVEGAFGEVSHEQKRAAGVCGQRQSRINRAGTSRERFCIVTQRSAPSRNDAVKAGKQKYIAIESAFVVGNH